MVWQEVGRSKFLSLHGHKNIEGRFIDKINDVKSIRFEQPDRVRFQRKKIERLRRVFL